MYVLIVTNLKIGYSYFIASSVIQAHHFHFSYIKIIQITLCNWWAYSPFPFLNVYHNHQVLKEYFFKYLTTTMISIIKEFACLTDANAFISNMEKDNCHTFRITSHTNRGEK